MGTEINDKLGINQIKEIVDEAGAGITAGNDQNLKVANAGWYTLHFKGKISKDKKNINWTLNDYKTQVCLICACIGQTDWGFANENALTPPDDPSGDWVSPVKQVRLSLSGTDFDRKKDYFLVLKDKDLNIEMQRYKVTIDLAFTDDFF